ncbi:hypothetical protein ACFOEY_13510 [Paracandidimonas soli]
MKPNPSLHRYGGVGRGSQADGRAAWEKPLFRDRKMRIARTCKGRM